MMIDAGKDANKLSLDELLGQLAEECGKLSQAAQKARRARNGTIPASLDSTLVELIDECEDLTLAIDALDAAGREV